MTIQPDETLLMLFTGCGEATNKQCWQDGDHWLIDANFVLGPAGENAYQICLSFLKDNLINGHVC
jgi:hypothetical protein